MATYEEGGGWSGLSYYKYPTEAKVGERVCAIAEDEFKHVTDNDNPHGDAYCTRVIVAKANGQIIAQKTAYQEDAVYDSSTDINTTTAELWFTVPAGVPKLYFALYYSVVSDNLGDECDSDSGYICNVIQNVVPTKPPSITVSSNPVGGQACTISWGASSDEDGNLDGYKVQRSVDGGTTWAQVYQGNVCTTTNTVPWGSNTVIYRVQAYDTDGAVSGWATATEADVFNNHAPTAPSTLTLPATFYAGADNTISWSAGADEDGNLSGYTLQFAGDDDAWATIYTGAATSYAHNVPIGLDSAQYRVRAYDAFDDVSGWTTATAGEIINNRPPVITVDDYDNGDDLGTVTAAPSMTYQVTDADGDDVTATVLLDGAEMGTAEPALGDDNTVTWTADAWMQVRNGDHTLQISANDGQTAGAFALTFTKAVNSLSVSLAESLPADAKIRWCTMLVKGFIPSDASMSLLVTNDADADEPVWEDMTEEAKTGVKHTFTHAPTSGHAFQFQLTLEVGNSGDGGYITALTGGFQ